jgi:lysophospholipid acyltransferase (LPLAT)-like uncharacterized protein
MILFHSESDSLPHLFRRRATSAVYRVHAHTYETVASHQTVVSQAIGTVDNARSSIIALWHAIERLVALYFLHMSSILLALVTMAQSASRDGEMVPILQWHLFLRLGAGRSFTACNSACVATAGMAAS